MIFFFFSYGLGIFANARVRCYTHWTLLPPSPPRLTPLWFQGTAGPLLANTDNWSSLCPTRSNSATWHSVTFPRASRRPGPSPAPPRSSPSSWVRLLGPDTHLLAAESPWRASIPFPSRSQGMTTLDNEGTKLGTFLYDQDGDSVQTFKLQVRVPIRAWHIVCD